MNKGYVFIGNSSKPSKEQNNSRSPVSLTNVSVPCVEAALNMGYEVWVGVNRSNPEELLCDYPVHLYDSHTYRSVTAIIDNITAFVNLARVIKNNNIKVIHCNTPIGGVIGRLVGRVFNIEKVVYTAHGFHFYEGAPLLNNIIFKTAERFMAHWTNVIITMNQEDYEAAQKFKLRNGGKVYLVHGVGINTLEYESLIVDREKSRAALNLKETDYVCISAGDLVPRKNYGIAIQAIAETKIPNLHYIICGEGPEKDNLINMSRELGIEEQIHFLGFRTDVKELMKCSDLFLFTSIQEGLPRSLMEAMAVSLPAVVSNIRGNTDLIDHGKGGYLFDTIESASNYIQILCANRDLRKQFGDYNHKVIKSYDIATVKDEIYSIYLDTLSNN